MPSLKGAEVRFLIDPETRYEADPNSGCHLWTGPLDKDGYGILTGDRAHRWFWKRRRGPIPDGHLVCHKCDTRCCVNTDHMFTGTEQANHDDMVAKGRRVDPMLGRRQPPHVGAAVADSNRRRRQRRDDESGRFLPS